MEIERHRLHREKNAGAYMEPSPDGNWVMYSDHAAALSTRDARIAELEAKHALLAAEVRAWRDADLRHDWIRDNTTGGVAATSEIDALICDMNATDEARALEEHP